MVWVENICLATDQQQHGFTYVSISIEKLMLRPMTTLITRNRRYPDVLWF
jgi:hypothetical protein